MSEELKKEVTEQTNEALQTEDSQQKVDESVQLIREISEAKQDHATNVSPEAIKAGDKIFSTLLTTVPIIIGIAMILIATFSGPGEKAGWVVAGMIFFLFGLLLQFLSKNVKKD